MFRSAIAAAAALSFASTPLLAQAHGMDGSSAFALIELPALAAAVIFGFLTARALRGGRLGDGMALIAWGFLVMAVGHLHMQGEVLFGFNLFDSLFGHSVGQVVWIVALLVTWVLTGFGFFRLYRASSSV
jgi:hypothetical protein